MNRITLATPGGKLFLKNDEINIITMPIETSQNIFPSKSKLGAIGEPIFLKPNIGETFSSHS